MNTYVITFMLHTGNTIDRVAASGFDRLDDGVIRFYDEDGKVVYLLAEGSWTSIRKAPQ